MKKKEDSSKEVVVPLKHFVVVLFIWLLAVPFSVVFFLSQMPKKSNQVLGTQSKEMEGEFKEKEEEVVLSQNLIEGKEIVVGDQVYSLSICFKGLCRNMFNADFRSLIIGEELDKYNFEKYIETNVRPYFESKYGKKVVVKNSKGEFLARVEDEVINYDSLFDKVNSAYLAGINNVKIELDYKITAGTDGKYADKYIEIDNSQQRLYVWEEGDIIKEIALSGPVYGYQVYGVFPIVDKGREPIAPGGKYMPYWMAFYYSKKQDSWYGLHALIWGYNEDGTKWYELARNIGTRQSAGCIRMMFDDAKWLYENFEKGDLILIHE